MSVLSAQSIRKLRPIEPFVERGVFEKRTFGLSACGYDICIAEDMWLWPFWGRLASSIERFNLPASICAEVKDKSSNARIFLTCQNTFIEPGWEGYLTLELTRHRPWPIKIKRGTPIAQIVFSWLDEPTEQPYAGRYQNQEAGPQPARAAKQGDA